MEREAGWASVRSSRVHNIYSQIHRIVRGRSEMATSLTMSSSRLLSEVTFRRRSAGVPSSFGARRLVEITSLSRPSRCRDRLKASIDDIVNTQRAAAFAKLLLEHHRCLEPFQVDLTIEMQIG